MGESTKKKDNAENITDGDTTRKLSKIAKKHKVYIHIGSIIEKYSDVKSYNTSYVLNPEGEIIGQYRKIHLFDIGIEGQPTYKESDTIQGGDCTEMIDLPVGKAGLSICYDLRFRNFFVSTLWKERRYYLSQQHLHNIRECYTGRCF